MAMRLELGGAGRQASRLAFHGNGVRRVELMILFMIAASVALATLGVVGLAYFVLFSPRYRLRRERIGRV
jgi:hypothetical protein